MNSRWWCAGLVLLIGCGEASEEAVEESPVSRSPMATASSEPTSSEPTATETPAVTQDLPSVPADGSATTSEGGELSSAASSEPAETTNVTVDPEAMQRLETMFQTYRQANAYADRGFVRVTGRYGDGEPLSMEIPMVSVFTRPNRLRLETYTTTMVSNGTELIAFIADYPGQIMLRPSPDRLTVRDLFADPILAEALTQGAIFRGELGFTQSVAWLPPPLLMMLDSDPGRTLLDEATSIETLPSVILKSSRDTAEDGGNAENAEIAEDKGSEESVAEGVFCHQVKVTRRDGTMILRMDAKTHLLLQMDFPVNDYGEIRQMVIRADFQNAAFTEPDSPTLFAWEIPEGIPTVEKLQPPREPAAEVIGKPVPAFSFAVPSGEPITQTTCADRPLLVTFWETDSPDSLDLLDLYRVVAEKYRDRIRILAVNVDPATVSQEAVDVKWREPEEGLAGTLLGVRDTSPDDPVAVRFGLGTIPTTFFVGTDGLIQDILTGLPLRELAATDESQSAGASEDTVEMDPAEVESRVEMLLAGNGLGTQRLSEISARREVLLRNFTQFEQRYATWLETWIADGRYRFTDTLMDAFVGTRATDVLDSPERSPESSGSSE